MERKQIQCRLEMRLLLMCAWLHNTRLFLRIKVMVMVRTMMMMGSAK
jgi:hypothetical protein